VEVASGAAGGGAGTAPAVWVNATNSVTITAPSNTLFNICFFIFFKGFLKFSLKTNRVLNVLSMLQKPKVCQKWTTAPFWK
jgi:hypothetical protein